MSDDDLIRRGDALALTRDPFGGETVTSQAIATLPAVTPATSPGVTAGAVARKLFPIMKGDGVKIDYQLVADHAEQARSNHYQSVERLAERGGLSWCELFAVLHNRKWEKIDANEAMIACRALEARYLSALSTPPTALDDPKVRKLVEAAAYCRDSGERQKLGLQHPVMSVDARAWADLCAALRDMEGV